MYSSTTIATLIDCFWLRLDSFYLLHLGALALLALRCFETIFTYS